MDVLNNQEVKNRLAHLGGWVLRGDSLEKDFVFVDFRAALTFMNHLAPTAEALNHHPDWSNTYNKVHISLTSHDAGGLTENDFQFAEAADEIAAQL